MAKAVAPGNIKWINIASLAAMAVLIIVAIRPWHAWKNTNPDARGVNLFSYFTVQSNLLAAAIFLVAMYLLVRNEASGEWFRYVRGAGVLYMIVTGVVYSTLLEGNADANASLGFDWKNFVLHKLAPSFMAVWWLVWPSRRPVSPRQSLYWLIFPAVWLGYTLIRGAAVGWYPYPFLDPAKAGGVGGVTLYIAGILVGFVALGQLVAWISRVRIRDESLY